MQMKNHLIDMANYHLWAYKRLFTKLDQLDDESYYKDYSLFFKSIHKTLNHLYLADKLWYSRFTQGDFCIKNLNDELCSNRSELQTLIIEQATTWINYTNKLENYPDLIHYVQTSGQENHMPFLSTIAHVFNHGTHHRGQITALLSQLNKDTPELDFSAYLRLNK